MVFFEFSPFVIAMEFLFTFSRNAFDSINIRVAILADVTFNRGYLSQSHFQDYQTVKNEFFVISLKRDSWLSKMYFYLEEPNCFKLLVWPLLERSHGQIL